jgi:beta-glucanase (GH16 family)
MFVFRTPKFEDWREIDIEVTGDGVDTVTSNLITANNTFTWDASIQEVSSYTLNGTNVRADFHDYAFEWLPDSITWYVDGNVVSQRKSGDGLPIPEKSAKIMMNLWIFNATAAFGGKDIQNNQYPMHSEYDWFRFYKWDGDATYPCASMDVSCLPADDTDLSSNNPCDGLPQVGDVAGKPACTATCK